MVFYRERGLVYSVYLNTSSSQMIQITDSSETSVSRKLHCAGYKKQNAILRSASFTPPNIMAHNDFLEELSSGSPIHGCYHNLVVKGRRLHTSEILRCVFWYTITDVSAGSAVLSYRVENCPWTRREKGPVNVSIYICISDCKLFCPWGKKKKTFL
jgi:hypothetical protein